MPPTLIYDDELGYLLPRPGDGAGFVIVAPPGPPPPTLPDPPANAPRVEPDGPPPPAVTPGELDDSYAAELELSSWPSEEDLLLEQIELAELDEEDQQGTFLGAARDPRVSFGGGVDAHLSRALACANCPGAPHDSRRQPWRACALRCWQSNNAVDIMAPVGFAIRSIDDGHVDRQLGYGLLSTSGGTAGYRLHVRADSGRLSWYQHMGPRIKERGARVRRGDVVGYVGRWPAFASHCHFAVSLPFNPEQLWEMVVSRTGRDRGTTPTPPAPVQPIPTPISPAERRTAQRAWNGLMDALGRDRYEQQTRVDRARRTIREHVRSPR